MERQTDRDRIAEEAVGQRHENAPPYAGTQPDISQEEAARRFAAASGAGAGIPEKTAESIGERVGDAYSDPEGVARHSPRKIGQQIAARSEPYTDVGSSRLLLAPVEAAKAVSRQLHRERLLTMVASFALGYLAAAWFHGRINAQFGTTSGRFQITKPPQGEKHPRGFVESAVLKTVTEHPQGMTTAEIAAQLGPQGIGRQSIASALGALVRAEKVSAAQGKQISPCRRRGADRTRPAELIEVPGSTWRLPGGGPRKASQTRARPATFATRDKPPFASWDRACR